jgi:hypothetical protein
LEKPVSLFGDIDASEVPDDPFHIDDGTYLCTLTEINEKHNEEKGTHGLSFNWTVTDEESEFNDSRVQDWKNIYPNLTADDLTPEIKQDLSRLKQRLAQIGVPEEEMGSFLENKDDYVGTEAYLTIRNWQSQDDPSKKGRNVTFVRLPEVE